MRLNEAKKNKKFGNVKKGINFTFFMGKFLKLIQTREKIYEYIFALNYILSKFSTI